MFKSNSSMKGVLVVAAMLALFYWHNTVQAQILSPTVEPTVTPSVTAEPTPSIEPTVALSTVTPTVVVTATPVPTATSVPTPSYTPVPTPETIVVPFDSPVDAQISFAPTPVEEPMVLGEADIVEPTPETVKNEEVANEAEGVQEEVVLEAPEVTVQEDSRSFLEVVRDSIIEFIENLLESIPNPFSQKRAKLQMIKDQLESTDVLELEASGKLDDLLIELVDSDGNKIEVINRIKEEDQKKVLEILKPRNFKPGQYRLKIMQNDEVILEQDFTWGVLAINVNKSIYLPDERAEISMAVLDEEGMMVCDANLELRIKNQKSKEETILRTQDGTIIVNPECQVHGFTLRPDYESEYQVGGVGKYEMELTATTQDGSYTISDAFEVRDSVPFDIDRISATRLFPPADYQMAIFVKANQDFRGVIEEPVPAVFSLSDVKAERLNTNIVSFDEIGVESETLDFDDSQLEKTEFITRDDHHVIRWHVNLLEGDIFEFLYTYNAPNKSPQFYLIGPLSFGKQELGVMGQNNVFNTNRIETQMNNSENTLPIQENSIFEELRSWQLAADAVGDFAVFRESTAAEAITTTQITMDWQQDVATNANITIDSGTRTLINLSEGGHYLVIYNLSFESTNATNARAEIQSWIDLAGTNLQYGRASCFIRNNGNANECYTAGSAIINAAAGDDLSIEVQRTDTGGVTVQRIANESGISVMKLDDTWDYARIHENTGGQALNNAGGFDSITWDDNADELDTGTFSHSTVTNPEEITLGSAGHYLVTANVMMRSTSTSNRKNRDMRVTLGNGTTQTEVDGTRTTAYIRGSNSSQDFTASYMGIIDAAANDILELQVGCIRNETTSSQCTEITNVGNQVAITIAKLPDSADYVRLHNTAVRDIDDATETTVVWQTAGEDEVDSTSFSHTTDSSQVAIDQTGDYLFFSSHYADRSADTSGTRAVPHWEWRLTGTTQQFGGFGRYNRGDQSTTGTFTSGNAGGIIFDGVLDTDYVELVNTEEANGSTDTLGEFQISRDAVQGVHIGSLFGAAPLLAQMHYHWRDDNGTESGASSLTSGTEDTVYYNMAKSTGVRLRVEVSNEGSASSSSTQYRLEYAELTSGACSGATGWTDVGAVGGDWDMYNSLNLTDGNNTTNIAEATGGVTDENTTFLTSNAAVKDTSSQTAGITLATTGFAEMEYSIQALSAATDNGTYCFRVTNAGTDIALYSVYPEITMEGPDRDQIHYHWRNDDGSESAATSATSGTDDTILTGLRKQTPKRVRVEVSNEGEITSTSTQYRLEYGVYETACSSILSWTDVGAVGGDWDMYNTTNLTDGSDTTNIAQGIGGMVDENTTFETPNAAVKDTSSQTAGITLANTDFAEIEYSVEATTSAPAGTSYCFRLTDAGSALETYTRYPRVTLADGASRIIGEIGSSSTDYQGTTINLVNTYDDPIVIAEPIEGDNTGSAANDSAAALITSIGSTSVNVRIQEPDNELDDHGTEGFYYLVVERGDWEFPDGVLVDADSLSTTSYYGNGVTGDTEADCNFTGVDFLSTPAVVTSLQTDNNTGTPDFLTVRTTSVSEVTDDFNCAIEVPDNETNIPGSAETIGWVAFDQGIGTNNSINYDIDVTAQSVQGWTDAWYTHNFTQTFSSAPVLVASKQTVGGADGGWQRYDTVTSSSFQIANDERNDGERSHTGSEAVGFFAFENAGSILAKVGYDLSAYRFFENANSTDVGAVLAAQDTAATLAADDQEFRLRVLVEQTQDALPQYGDNFKLQYAARSGTCDTSFTGETYADVTTSTPIAYYNNTTPADGAALTGNANDPTHGADTIRNQTYEESNNFSNTQLAVAEGEHGKYDFALTDYSAPESTTYCLRVVQSDGSLFDSYSTIPEITTAAFSVMGTVYMGDEVTLATSGNGGPCDGSTSNLSVRVNGGVAYTGVCSSSTATYNISGMSPTAGNSIAVYQTDTTDKANTIYVTDRGTSDQGIDLYLDTLVVRDDQDGTLSILDIDDYDNDQNSTDMLYDADDLVTDIVTVDSGVELHVWTGDTFDPGGDVNTQGAAGDLHIDDSALMEVDTSTSTIAGDVLVDSGATWRVNADAQVNGGSITMSGVSPIVTTTVGTPTVIISGTGSIGGGTTPTITFYNLGTSGSGTTTLSDATTVDNDVAVGVGTTLRINANLTVNGGDLTTTSTGVIDYTSGTPVVYLNGTGNLGGGSGSVSFYNLDVGDGTADTTTVGSSFSVDDDLILGTNQTLNVGLNSVTVGSSGVSNSGRLLVGSNSVYNQTGGTTMIQSSDGGILAQVGGAGTTTAYNLDIGPSTADNLTYTVSTGGTLAVTNDLIVQDAGVADNHTFDVSAGNDAVTVGGSVTIDANATFLASTIVGNPLTIGGNFTNNGTFTHGNGRVVFNDAAKTSTLLYSGATTFGDIFVNTAGKALQFDNVDQTNILGTLDLQGINCDTGRVFLDSDVNDSLWEVNATGTVAIDYADVEDSDAITALLATNSTEDDFQSNNNWTIDRGVCGSISFAISDNTIGFGDLSSSTDRFATGDVLGSGSEVEAHTITASTNAPGGYVIALNGDTLTAQIGPYTITQIGGTNTASNPGTEQFGLRVNISAGTGTVTAPYDGSGFAYDAGPATWDQVASGQGDAVTTTYSVRYIGNVTTVTEASPYDATVTYTVTGTF